MSMFKRFLMIVVAVLVGTSLIGPIKADPVLTLPDQHCGQSVRQSNSTDLPLVEFARCFALERCLRKHLNPLLRGIQHMDFGHHAEMYQCASDVLSPRFIPSDTAVEIKSPTEILEHQIKQKIDQDNGDSILMSEADFLSTLLTNLNSQSPYLKLMQALQYKRAGKVNAKNRARVQMGPLVVNWHLKELMDATLISNPYYILVLKPREEISYNCFEHLMVDGRYTKIGQLERSLELVYYCRGFTISLDQLLIEYLNAHDQEAHHTVLAKGKVFWDFFKCSKAAFQPVK